MVDAAALLVDEAALTGESVPVEKTAAGPDQASGVSAGAMVVRGRGRAVVRATGAASSMGRGAALLGAQPGLTPLQRRLAGVGRALAAAAGIVPVLITGDHPATARAIATDLGIVGPGEPVIDCRAPGGKPDGTARVFARATPEQKLSIIAGRHEPPVALLPAAGRALGGGLRSYSR